MRCSIASSLSEYNLGASNLPRHANPSIAAFRSTARFSRCSVLYQGYKEWRVRVVSFTYVYERRVSVEFAVLTCLPAPHFQDGHRVTVFFRQSYAS